MTLSVVTTDSALHKDEKKGKAEGPNIQIWIKSARYSVFISDIECERDNSSS